MLDFIDFGYLIYKTQYIFIYCIFLGFFLKWTLFCLNGRDHPWKYFHDENKNPLKKLVYRN